VENINPTKEEEVPYFQADKKQKESNAFPMGEKSHVEHR